MTRSPVVQLSAAVLAVAAVVPTPLQQGVPDVALATVWIGEVQGGELTIQVRGPGVLERFGPGFHAHVRIASLQAAAVGLDQRGIIDTRQQVLEGRVVDIAERVEKGTLVVVVELNGDQLSGLRPGLSVDGRIETGHLTDVLLVDRPAFAMPEQTTGIFKIVDDGAAAERVAVTWGTASVDKIEVASGLREGDRIILSDMSRYDGVDRVRLR